MGYFDQLYHYLISTGNDSDTFLCNYVFTFFSEGHLLIEDLRAEGVFTTQPKSNFSSRKNRKRLEAIAKLPSVVVPGENPVDDYRTIVELNMMGI